jgi:hypothetical protein
MKATCREALTNDRPSGIILCVRGAKKGHGAGKPALHLPNAGNETIFYSGHISAIAFQFFPEHAFLPDSPEGKQTDEDRRAEHPVPGPQQ